MLPFALSALEKAARIPAKFWILTVVGILGFIVAVILARKIFETNKFILAVVSFLFVGILGFNWIYERNEPKFLTPLVDHIAPFFPSKGAYEVKQQSDPTAPKQKAAPKKPAPAR